MSNPAVNVLVDQKREYLRHLKDVATEPMVAFMRSVYDRVLSLNGTRTVLQRFQDELALIPEWNANRIHDTYQEFIRQSRCEYFPDLLKAIFMTYGRIHMATVSGTDKLQMRVPNAENFIHKCYVSIARSLWKRPYLLYHDLKDVEKQRNLVVLEDLVSKNISMTIMSCLPMTNMVSHVVSEQSVALSVAEEDEDTEDYESEEDDTDHEEQNEEEPEEQDEEEAEQTEEEVKQEQTEEKKPEQIEEEVKQEQTEEDAEQDEEEELEQTVKDKPEQAEEVKQEQTEEPQQEEPEQTEEEVKPERTEEPQQAEQEQTEEDKPEQTEEQPQQAPEEPEQAPKHHRYILPRLHGQIQKPRLRHQKQDAFF
jgi:DNA polymerase III gamma/tau subunit